MRMLPRLCTLYFLGLAVMLICCIASGNSLSTRRAGHDNESLATEVENYGDDGSCLEKNNDVSFRFKRDLGVDEMNVLAPYNVSGRTTPFARFITTRTISLIKGLKSFNNIASIPVRNKEKFIEESIGLLRIMGGKPSKTFGNC